MNSEPARSAELLIDVLVESPLWRERPSAAANVRKAIRAAAEEISSAGGEVAVVLADDGVVRRLNKQWRGIDKPTNVLSFPAATSGPGSMLGDIVLAYETLMRECRDEGREFNHHLSHLAVHGFLHLNGYDHQTDADAETMEALESDIMVRLRMPDPYLVRNPG